MEKKEKQKKKKSLKLSDWKGLLSTHHPAKASRELGGGGGGGTAQLSSAQVYSKRGKKQMQTPQLNLLMCHEQLGHLGGSHHRMNTGARG